MAALEGGRYDYTSLRSLPPHTLHSSASIPKSSRIFYPKVGSCSADACEVTWSTLVACYH